MMKILFYLLGGLFLLKPEVQAQDFFSISGKVLDADSQKEIAFASVSVAGLNVATITNREGGFVLKLDAHPVDSCIVISHLGYRTRKLPLSFFKPTGKNRILLKRAAILLPEVQVRQAEAAALMREVFRRIPRNYSPEPNQMVGFYREMIRRNSAYVSVAEAVLDIYKAPYSGALRDQTRIYKGRRSIDRARMDTLFIKYQGGVETALALDLAKNYTDLFPPDFELYYDFYCESYTAWDDRPQYVIYFNQKKTVDWPLFRGRLYIDAESYAITKVEFNMNIEGDKKAAAIFLKKKPVGVKMEVEEASYLIQFRRQGAHWYYQYSRANLRFRCKWPRHWFHSAYSLQSEMAVTDRTREGVSRFPHKERLAPGTVLAERVADFQDAGFWESYNIIEPEQTIENAIRKLARKLKRREK